jgi:hypothetical protein
MTRLFNSHRRCVPSLGSQARLGQEHNGELQKQCCTNRSAKPIVLSYIYGRNRSATARNKQAYLVQEHVANHFPKTHSFVWKNKLHDHTAFACRLQNLEADLFLGGIFGELMQRQIPALTVHDSIAVPLSRQQKAVEICRDVLGRRLAGKARIKVNQQGTDQETTLTV